MPYLFEEYQEIYQRNPHSRFPSLATDEVRQFKSWDEATAYGVDLPGFDHNGVWVSNPFWSDRLMHCGGEDDPMEAYGFTVHGSSLRRLDEKGRVVILTRAMGVGLPTGECDWRMRTTDGVSICTRQGFWVVTHLREDVGRCHGCGEGDDDERHLHEFRVYHDRGAENVLLCESCLSMANEPEPGEFSEGYRVVIPFTAFERAMTSVSVEAHNFNSGLAVIQENLGQNDGGPASLFFSGREQEWTEASDYERLRTLDEYVRYELEWKAEEEADAEIDRAASDPTYCPSTEDHAHAYTWSDDGLEQVCDYCGGRRRSTDDEIREWVEVQRQAAREEALAEMRRQVKSTVESIH